MDPLIKEIFDHANSISIIFVLFFIIYSGYKRWWVWGWIHSDVVKRLVQAEADRDEWRIMALTGTRTAHTAITMAEKATSTP